MAKRLRSTDFTLCNCFLRAAKLTENVDADKYRYSDYGIGFDTNSPASVDGSQGKNVVILGINNRYSVSVDNKNKKDIFVIGEGSTEALDDAKITVEAKYPINFLEQRTDLC